MHISCIFKQIQNLHSGISELKENFVKHSLTHSCKPCSSIRKSWSQICVTLYQQWVMQTGVWLCLRLVTCSLKMCLRATDMKDPSVRDRDWGKQRAVLTGWRLMLHIQSERGPGLLSLSVMDSDRRLSFRWASLTMNKSQLSNPIHFIYYWCKMLQFRFRFRRC